MTKKFTHAMAKFVLLQITVLSLTAERLPLMWFCAQGTQKDVQRPCTCQMQYTNVGQCVRYKLFTGEVYQAACQYHMCNLMYLSSFQFSSQDRKTVSMLTNNVWESVTIQATHLIIDVLLTYIHTRWYHLYYVYKQFVPRVLSWTKLALIWKKYTETHFLRNNYFMNLIYAEVL